MSGCVVSRNSSHWQGHRKLIGGSLLVCPDDLAPLTRWPIRFSLVVVDKHVLSVTSPKMWSLWQKFPVCDSNLGNRGVSVSPNYSFTVYVFFSLSPTLLSIEILWVAGQSGTGSVERKGEPASWPCGLFGPQEAIPDTWSHMAVHS